MKYNEEIIKKLKDQIKNQINEFEYNKEIINKLYKSYKTNERFMDSGCILEIKNNQIIKEFIGKKEYNRINDIIQLIENSIQYIKKKNMNYPDTKLFLFISDVYVYWDQELPVFILAKPKNKKGILIPDNTFNSHRDASSKMMNWEETKLECYKNIVPINKKKDKLFFIGGNTDKSRQDIRSNLKKLSNGESVYGIKTNNKELPLDIRFEHNLKISEFGEYKYLLNLPGNQPWSYRFKYLFLTKSLVINVDVHQRFKGGDGFNESWINFFDVIFERNLDYINLPFHWFDSDEKYDEYEFKKLICGMENTYDYFEKNPEKYEQMVSNGYSKAQNITSDLISEAIFLLVHYYAKKINPFL